jgi:GST-like protein
MMEYILCSSPGTGADIIEAALRICDLPYRLVTIDYEKSFKGKIKELKKLNRQSRFPTLITPRNEVMTESGAMIIHLANLFPPAELMPTMNLFGSWPYGRVERRLLNLF